MVVSLNRLYYRIGGEALQHCDICTTHEALAAADLAQKQKRLLLPIGRGSNTLFTEGDYTALIVRVLNKERTHADAQLILGAGHYLPTVVRQLVRDGFGGLEHFGGIPGTLGGAIYMNAGAHGQSLCDPLVWVEALDCAQGTLHRYSKESLDFGYRTSLFQKIPHIILRACFAVHRDPHVGARYAAMLHRRTTTQPWKEPSLGCMFRNPPGQSAGALIEKCGLKGSRWGGIEVSRHHANFFINLGSAQSGDVLAALGAVRETVAQKTGYTLQTEAEYVHTDGTKKSLDSML